MNIERKIMPESAPEGVVRAPVQSVKTDTTGDLGQIGGELKIIPPTGINVIKPPENFAEPLNPDNRPLGVPFVPPLDDEADQSQAAASTGLGGTGGTEPPDRGDGGNGRGPEDPRGSEFPDDDEPPEGSRGLEVARLIEKTKQQESEPQYWMTFLQELHNLPAIERQARIAEYNEACQRLARFAHPEKLFGNSAKVAILEEQLTAFEEQEIRMGNRTEEEKEVLRNLLDDLTKQENELIRVRNSLGLQKDSPEFFTKDQWIDLEEREDQLLNDPDIGINNLKADIVGRTSPDFLSNRDKLKINLDTATEIVKKEEEQVNQQELSELRDEPDEWMKEQEEKLLIDKEPILREPAENLQPFSEVLEFFNQQQKFKEEGSDQFWSEGYNRAQEALSWYFHEAKKLGATSDLEDRLDHQYQEWAIALIPHREINPYDGSARITQKTFSEIQDEIIEYFNNLLDSGKSQYVEHEKRWNYLQRRNVNPVARSALQGIRVELVRRAQIQIEDSLSNLNQQLKGEPAGPIPIDRISGEWNVHILQKRIRESRERQEAQERNEPLFKQESYYRIALLGRNREDIERGADQAAEYIIRSATTYSLEVVRQRMDLLTQGIEERLGVLQASEGVSEAAAKGIVTEIQRAITNKLDFFVLDWTASNLLMDQFAGYYSDRLRLDGDQKLKVIPAMNDGQVGLAYQWLNSPLYELYHRPQGFKGQLYDDDQTHKFERSLMKEQIIKKLMEYELRGKDFREKTRNRPKLKDGPTIHEFLQQFNHLGVIPPGIIPKELIPADSAGKKDPTSFFNALSQDQKLQMFDYLLSLQTPDQNPAKQLFNSLTPDQRVGIRRLQYERILQAAKDKEKAKEIITFEYLAKVREAKKILAEEQNWYQMARGKAESAFDTADKVMNIFGDAADLGAPSIIMQNGPEVIGPEGQITQRGDFISISDYALVQKYAILQVDHKEEMEIDGKKYQVKDNPALIRYRSKMFIRAWKAAGLNRELARSKYIELVTKEYKEINQKPPKFMLNLNIGFEETGLTVQEWDAFKNADNKLRKNGYEAEIGGVKVEDILKKRIELEAVMNNFLADYKSSESGINDPNVIKQVARGRITSTIANIRKKLGFSRRQSLEGTTQQQIDEYTQRIEDSRSLHAELERLAYFAATHDPTKAPMMIERGKPVYAFSADRIDYGYQRQSWGIKRLHHLKAFWYTNLRRTVPRAADLIHAMPFSLTSLRKELAFDSFLEMCWAVGKMESIDNPALVAMGSRHQAMGTIRGSGEGSISDRDWKKLWGFLEKPLVDANSLWKLVHFIQGKSVLESLNEALKNPIQTIGQSRQENIINHLQDTTFSRFIPILVATEKSLGEDRQALSAGSGYEENDKFALRFLEWLMSNKPGDGREQGGSQVQAEIADIIKLITTPNSYRKGATLWDEFWRKQTPSHNPRLPNPVPKPTITAI